MWTNGHKPLFICSFPWSRFLTCIFQIIVLKLECAQSMIYYSLSSSESVELCTSWLSGILFVLWLIFRGETQNQVITFVSWYFLKVHELLTLAILTSRMLRRSFPFQHIPFTPFNLPFLRLIRYDWMLLFIWTTHHSSHTMSSPIKQKQKVNS